MESLVMKIPRVSQYDYKGAYERGESIEFHFHDGQFYRLNVDGEIFLTKLKLPITKFERLSQNKFIFDKITAYEIDGPDVDFFINSDPEIFPIIVNYCRSGLVILPEEFKAYNLLIDEANDFKLKSLAYHVDNLLVQKSCTDQQ
ncbi:unnamed protein product [Diamesa hyperborea]